MAKPLELSATALLLALANFAFLQAETTHEKKLNSQGSTKQKSQHVLRNHGQTLARTQAGGFHIDVVAIEDLRGQSRSIEFDTSRMELKSSITEQGDSNEQRFGDARNGGFGRGSVSGFAGAAGGVSTATYRPPNYGMALSITPVRKNKAVVEIGSRAAVYDSNNGLIDEYDIGPTIHHFQAFEQRHPGKHFLYFANKKRGIPDVQRVIGDLRVTPGETWSAEFIGAKPQSKKTPRGNIKLTSVLKNDDGIVLTIEFPLPTNLRHAKSPLERFQAKLSNRSTTRVWIIDDAGNRHQPQSVAVGGQGDSNSASTSFSHSGRRSGRMQMRIRGGTRANQPHQVSFAPLPEDRKIRVVHAQMMDRTGDVETVPFEIRFEN